jgi:dihydroorotase-like cyclic amidohydrolase
MLFFAELTHCPLYIVHSTAARTSELAAEARLRGVSVTVETCQHYLARTALDNGLEPWAKLCPPLRLPDEVETLWRQVLDGRIETLGSDHVSFPRDKTEGVWESRPGDVSFAWELPLIVSEGFYKRGLPLTQIVYMTSLKPAQCFGLYPQKGSLAVGADADLVLVDLDEERVVSHEGHGTCIYEGMRLKGWPVMTISRGRVVFENDEIDPDASGHGVCVTRLR